MDYATLPEAFVAAQEGETITVLKDLEISEAIPVTKSVTLALNGKTITNNTTNNRLFRLSGVDFTIDGNGGKFVASDNTMSYGFIDFSDASGVASASTKLHVSDASFEGGTNDGSFFKMRSGGQSIILENVTVDMANTPNGSVINAYGVPNVKVEIKGGSYTYESTYDTNPVFNCGQFPTISFEGVTVSSTRGPVVEIVGGTATFTDCDMTTTATNSFFASCIAPSNGAQVTVNGGTYTANYPLYIYNSGGTIDVEGGEFNGNIASIKADNKENASYESVVTVADGRFNGPISVDNRSKLEVAENSSMVETTDAEGKTVYIAAPVSSDIAAFVGTTSYPTLEEAFAAAEEGQKIVVFKDIDVNSMIPVTKSVTLDLNGKTLTNNVTGNRMFLLSGVTFTIDGKDGSIITPETNTQSYGFFVFRDANDVSSPDAKLVASNMTFSGGTANAYVFMLCKSGQTIDFTDVNVNLTKSRTWSIINAYELGVNISIKGGEFTYDSTVTNAGVFQCGDNSTVNFDGVTVNTTSGPIFRVPGEHTTGTFTNCTMTNTDTNGYFGACVAVSHGANVTVDGGTYTSNYPLYIYNTGGTLNVEGGEFNGKVNAIQADNAENASYESLVNVSGGTFEGPIKTTGSNSKIQIKGGTYSEKPAQEYFAPGYQPEENPDGTFGVKEDVSVGIEGVEGAEAAEGAAKGIYNLFGVRIDGDVKSLPAGIYIIDGKKVVVSNR